MAAQMTANFVADGSVLCGAERVRGTPALKLGLPERSWACFGVLRFIMESGAKGFIASGKLRAQRAKSMKVKDGYMISSGQPVIEYIDRLTLLCVMCFLDRLAQSFIKIGRRCKDVLGIKVEIILDWDPKGQHCPTTPLPDLVTIHQPKEEGYMRPSVLATEIPVEIEVPVLAA